MKKLYYILSFLATVLYSVGCILIEPQDEGNCNNDYSSLDSPIWKTPLEPFYIYKDPVWYDLGEFISVSVGVDLQATRSIQTIRKSTGKIENDALISYFTFDKIQLYKNKMYIAENNVFEFDLLTGNYKKLFEYSDNIFIGNDISLLGNTILFSYYDRSDSTTYFTTINLDNIETKIIYKIKNEGLYYRKIDNPFLVISESGDSIIYYKIDKEHSSGDPDIRYINMKTGSDKLAILKNGDRHEMIVKDGFLYDKNDDNISKINPVNFSQVWSIESCPTFLFNKLYFNAGNLIYICSESAISVDSKTGAVNWKVNFADFDFFNIINEVKQSAVMDSGFIYITFKDRVVVLNAESGKLIDKYCEIPAGMNFLSQYSDGKSIYGINFSKNIIKNEPKFKL